MKNKRQLAILEIIKNEEISTQEELTERLNKKGFKATQATVSRDIKELKLIKVHSDIKGNKYSHISSQSDANGQENSVKFYNIIKEAFLSCDYANNIVIVKTMQGMAQGVAFAMENIHFEGLMGTIAGDDTIMIVTKNDEFALRIVNKINGLKG